MPRIAYSAPEHLFKKFLSRALSISLHLVLRHRLSHITFGEPGRAGLGSRSRFSTAIWELMVSPM